MASPCVGAVLIYLDHTSHDNPLPVIQSANAGRDQDDVLPPHVIETMASRFEPPDPSDPHPALSPLITLPIHPSFSGAPLESPSLPEMLEQWWDDPPTTGLPPTPRERAALAVQKKERAAAAAKVTADSSSHQLDIRIRSLVSQLMRQAPPDTRPSLARRIAKRKRTLLSSMSSQSSPLTDEDLTRYLLDS